MTLRFYKGGPRAVRDSPGLFTTPGIWVTYGQGLAGCSVALRAGARIPRSAYDVWDTAILPLEF